MRPPRPSGLLRLQPVCYSQASHHPSPGTKQHVHFITRLCSAQRDLLISVSAVFICDSARNVFTVHGALLDTACLHLNINIGSRGEGGSSSPLIPPSFIKMFIWKSAGPFIWLLLRAGSNNNSGSLCHTRQTKYTLGEGFQWPLDPSSSWHSTSCRALGGLPGPVMQLFIPNSTGSDPAPACCYCWRCPQKPPESRRCLAGQGGLQSFSPALPDSGSALKLSHSTSITFPRRRWVCAGPGNARTNSSLVGSSQRRQGHHKDPVLRLNLVVLLSFLSFYPTISFQRSLPISYLLLHFGFTNHGEAYFEKALSRPRPHSEGVRTPDTFLVTSSWSSEAQETLKPLRSGVWV